MKNMNIKLVIVYLGILVVGCAQTAPPTNSPNTSAQNAPNSSDVDKRPPVAPPLGTAAIGNNEYPRIVVVSTSKKTKRIKHTFTFEEQEYSISIKVNKAILDGARKATKYAVSKAGQSDTNWREKFNLAFIEDPAQDSFLDSLHAKLKSLSKSLHLDKDRTVELFTAFVQYIEYDTQENAEAKFPIETFADRKGDCDDKSRLLVALLSRSGFYAATLNFNEENHMAVGIRSNGLEYKGTGYSYIETTSPSLVGFPFSENADVQLNTTPVPQRIGSGKKKYEAATQIEYLVKTKYRLENEIQKDQKSLDKVNEKCAKAGDEVKKYQQKLKDASNSSASKQNREVSKYNDAVDDYNKLVTKQQKLARGINSKINIRNYIAKHAINRHNTYKWVKKKMGKPNP